MAGIVSYGFYIPTYRIKTEEIAHIWGKNPDHIKESLKIEEKAVAGLDEDSVSMGYEACSMAISDIPLQKNTIKALFFGSETPPYAVNPASTILGEFLDIGHEYVASDTQFACKAGTGAMISALGLLSSGFTDYALVCAADKATGKPHDALEYTAGSGATAFLLGKENCLAHIVAYDSFSSDTPDFWRREGIRHPSHGGRFTGKPSYFFHIRSATQNLLKKTGMKPDDFAYGVFHMPNGKFPLEVGISLGFTSSQIEPSLVVTELGNSYTASALMGLIAVLEKVKPGEKIFFASYGSGAGSDAFILEATADIGSKRKGFRSFIQ
ncbi:MAG: hydroxymethylglutaryl-CoA synthase, partial [bacterium]|nr:hydroxymethylglutaryl-CoA synthase [bacterium]